MVAVDLPMQTVMCVWCTLRRGPWTRYTWVIIYLWIFIRRFWVGLASFSFFSTSLIGCFEWGHPPTTTRTFYKWLTSHTHEPSFFQVQWHMHPPNMWLNATLPIDACLILPSKPHRPSAISRYKQAPKRHSKQFLANNHIKFLFNKAWYRPMNWQFPKRHQFLLINILRYIILDLSL